MKGPRLKLWRANAHLDALGEAIDRFLKREPYEVVSEHDPDSGQQLFWSKIRENPPEEWSAIIGDVLHNSRSSLDHLVWQLVLLAGNEPTRSTAFPIFRQDPLSPDADPQTRNSWESKVKGLPEPDVEIIKAVQPYTRGDKFRNHPLFLLNEMVNWDKHKELHVVAGHFKMMGFDLDWDRGRGAREWAFSPFAPLDFRAVAFPILSEKEVDVQAQTTINVTFRDGEYWEFRSVWPTLVSIANFVTDVINEFEGRFPPANR